MYVSGTTELVHTRALHTPVRAVELSLYTKNPGHCATCIWALYMQLFPLLTMHSVRFTSPWNEAGWAPPDSQPGAPVPHVALAAGGDSGRYAPLASVNR